MCGISSVRCCARVTDRNHNVLLILSAHGTEGYLGDVQFGVALEVRLIAYLRW
jgi:hypothetical protein